jgi:hypothetical protein
MTQKVQIMFTFLSWLDQPQSQIVRLPDGFGGNLTLICPSLPGYQGETPLAGKVAT